MSHLDFETQPLRTSSLNFRILSVILPIRFPSPSMSSPVAENRSIGARVSEIISIPSIGVNNQDILKFFTVPGRVAFLEEHEKREMKKFKRVEYEFYYISPRVILFPPGRFGFLQYSLTQSSPSTTAKRIIAFICINFFYSRLTFQKRNEIWRVISAPSRNHYIGNELSLNIYSSMQFQNLSYFSKLSDSPCVVCFCVALSLIPKLFLILLTLPLTEEYIPFSF